MAEGTYEYECMRAELLGVEKPDYDEFTKRQKEQLAREAEEERAETECLTNAEDNNATLSGVSSRLDELNTILASTQKRISRFKTSCGTFTNLIKSKIGRQNSNSSLSIAENVEGEETAGVGGAERAPPEGKSEVCSAVEGNIGKLDSLIDKADRAYFSMERQRKQMDKFLK